MRRIVDPSLSARWLRLLALGICILALTGCAALNSARLSPVYPEQVLKHHRFAVEKGAAVIGRLAVIRVEQGDTLPDMARHFSVGINAISAANPGVDLWVPEVGERITLPLSFILPDAPRKGIVVNLATMRLFHFKEEGGALTVSTYPVGVGTKERPTPTGQMHVARKASRPTWHVPASIAEDHRKKGDPLPAKVPPGPDNPLGEYALYLSKSSYLIHGTNKPASIGLKATNGCLRLYPENIGMLYQDTPVNTPVVIVNQPYLIGQRDGVLYLEAHKSREGSGASELENINAILKAIESKLARALDWSKVRKVQAEARGIPVPILELRRGAEQEAAKTLEVEHPARWYGRPEIPELNLDAWNVLAGDVRDEIDAQRLAAIINHQGPPIPARVLAKSAKSTGYRVIAGPFADVSAAKAAVKRLKMDLDIDAAVIDPVRQISRSSRY
jgi:L,D-transpeptidase ErfK/SrfK